MKRILLLCIVLFVIAGSLIFAGGQRTASSNTAVPRGVGDWKYKYPQTVTATIGRDLDHYNFFDGEDFENNAYTRWIKDTYNYEIKTGFFTSSSDDHTQRVTLAIASGNLPDIMEVYNRQQFAELMESGLVEDLTGLFDQWASPLFKAALDTYGGLENVMSTTFLNGRQYGFSSAYAAGSDSLFWIREDWRLRLGLPEPKTIDDFVALAQAFVNNDMAGNRMTTGLEMRVPITGRYNGYNVADPFFNEVGAYPRLWIDDSNGKIVYGSVTPQAKEGLRTLRDMYARGILSRDFATKDHQAAIAAGQIGVVIGPWWIADYPLNYTFNNNPNAIWKVYNWTSAKTGKRYGFQNNTAGMWIVARKGFSNPELIPRLLNLTTEVRCFYSPMLSPEEERRYELAIPENVREAYAGRQGVAWNSWPCSIQIDFKDMMPRLARMEGQNLDRFKAGNTAGMDAATRTTMENIVKWETGADRGFGPWNSYMGYTAKQYDLADERTIDIKGTYWPSNTATMQLRWSNLTDLENLAYTDIIMGRQPLDYFDTFVRQWYDQGGTRITEEVNRQYGK